MDIKRLWRKHGGKIVFGFLIAASLVVSRNDISRNMRSLEVTKNVIATNNEQQSLLEETARHEAEQAKVAESRYRKGCVIVVAVKDPSKFVTLVEEQPVLDATSKHPLPVGTVVCDAHGNTGVLVKGVDETQSVVSHMAFTGDHELVKGYLKRSPKTRYSQPNIN